MKAFLYLVTTSLLFHHFGLHNYLSHHALSLQNFCLNNLPKNSTQLDYFSAFICGKNLDNNSLKNTLVVTSVYHIIVVSGSHLTFVTGAIELLLNLFRPQRWHFILISFLLLLFCFSTGLQAPILRAFFCFILKKISEFCELNWSPIHTLTLSGLLCLVLFPDWINSYSLLLSWIASIGILIGGRLVPVQCFATYCLTLPLLAGWGQLNPLGIIINILFIPIISFASWLATVALPLFPNLSDSIVKYVISILNKLEHWIKLINIENSFPQWTLWAYLIFLTISVHSYLIHKNRAQWKN